MLISGDQHYFVISSIFVQLTARYSAYSSERICFQRLSAYGVFVITTFFRVNRTLQAKIENKNSNTETTGKESISEGTLMKMNHWSPLRKTIGITIGICLMMWSVSSIVDAWYNAMDNYSDPRVNDWFLMDSVFPTVAVIVVYVFFVTILGPKLMEKRKPYDLNNIMLVYNFLQVIISAILFKEALVTGWNGKYSWRCQPVDYSADGLGIARASYMYYLSKFTELADTVFFVLRKKNNQVTALHVAHHGIMPISVWFGVKFVAGGHGTFFGLLNTFVHIWMYLYYFLAALGPKVQPYLWWKKHLTSMQIIQFILILIHGLQVLFIECEYPRICVWIINLHAMFFLFMFRDFYTKEYISKAEKKSEFNVANLEVDPHREGIKQSDLWAHNYDHLVNKRRGNEVKRD